MNVLCRLRGHRMVVRMVGVRRKPSRRPGVTVEVPLASLRCRRCGYEMIEARPDLAHLVNYRR